MEKLSQLSIKAIKEHGHGHLWVEKASLAQTFKKASLENIKNKLSLPEQIEVKHSDRRVGMVSFRT